MLTSVLLFGSSLFFSFLFTWLVRNIAVRRGWVSYPQSSRHVHRNPVPRLGGVAIYLAFLASGTVVIVARILTGHSVGVPAKTSLAIICSGSLIFLIGLIDDLFDIRPLWKFSSQIVAAIMLYAFGLRVVIAPMFRDVRLGGVAGLFVTVLWVVWITNAFNLIDGMDGLAAGSALLSTVVVFLNALISGNALTLFFTAGLAGAVLGFLKFNFSPASIFLGDCGSLFIGFLLAALAIPGTKSPTMVAVALPVVAFGLPVLDTSLSVVRRFLSGRPLFSADREHIHHKLLDKGLSQRQAVLVLYGVSALFGLLSLFLKFPNGRVTGAVLVIVGTIILVAIQKLGYVEMIELHRVAVRTLEQRQIIVNNLVLRRTSQQLATTSDFGEIARLVHSAFQQNDFSGYEFVIGAHFPSVMQTLNIVSHRDGRPVLYWHKREPLAAKGWKMTLDLVDSHGNDRGALTLFRSYIRNSIMVDVNLLTSEFPLALADALDRAEQSLAHFHREPSSRGSSTTLATMEHRDANSYV